MFKEKRRRDKALKEEIKTFYEVYNKEKSIVKTADGKLYKLTPVQIKR